MTGDVSFSLTFEEALFHELNAEHYEPAKTGRIQFNHPDGTHYDVSRTITLLIRPSKASILYAQTSQKSMMELVISGP